MVRIARLLDKFAKPLAALGLALAVLAVTPTEWIGKLGAWSELLLRSKGPLLIILIASLLARWAWLEFRRTAMNKSPIRALGTLPRFEGPKGTEDDVHFVPMDVYTCFLDVLRELRDVDSGTRHVIRIWTATGATVLGPLKHYVDLAPTSSSSFDIRVLLMDPDSPRTREAGHQWPEESIESIRKLAAIKESIRDKARPIKLDWRLYPQTPALRLLLINDTHLFFGFNIWSIENEIPQLHQQASSYTGKLFYVRAGDPHDGIFIEAAQNLFDHEWEAGRQARPSVGAEV
jgi:hypothetical protein